MDTTTEVKNLNKAQHEYMTAKKEARRLLHEIERSLLDKPAACNGNWAMVGDMQDLVNVLKGTQNRLDGTGEYASTR